MAAAVEDNIPYTSDSYTSASYPTEAYSTDSVRSRISWGAILAGAAVAMAIYALLMSLGVAVGMSVDYDANNRNFGTSAGVWSFISLLVSLFVGGWVTTQVTVGESRGEAVLYGVVLWATTSVLLLWLTANGIQAGANLARVANDSNVVVGSVDSNSVDSNSVGSNASESRQVNRDQLQVNRDQLRDDGREGAWWAFAGILLSMVAAVVGALLGPVELTVRRDTRHAHPNQYNRSTRNDRDRQVPNV